SYTLDDLQKIYNDEVLRCIDKIVEKKMIDLIEKTKKRGDTLGGIFEVIALNIIPGLGSFIQYTNKLDAKLAAAILAIQGIKGIEFGAGFDGVRKFGSQFHDEFDLSKQKKIIRKSNNAGGIEGGMSNGCNIVFRAAMKPIPTLMSALQSVDLEDCKIKKAIVERSDVCVVPAAGVVAEAVTALTLFNIILEEFGYDNIKLIRKRYFDKLKLLEKKYKFSFYN
ncbi:MAG TPA: chorismate synthase, partial [bacterium]|nr:chorismate synthase [bacterium]